MARSAASLPRAAHSRTRRKQSLKPRFSRAALDRAVISSTLAVPDGACGAVPGDNDQVEFAAFGLIVQ
jgi:hypothetical protein